MYLPSQLSIDAASAHASRMPLAHIASTLLTSQATDTPFLSAALLSAPSQFMAHLPLFAAIAGLVVMLGAVATLVLRAALFELHRHLDNLKVDGISVRPSGIKRPSLLDMVRPDLAIRKAALKVGSLESSVRKWQQELSDRERKHLEWLAFLGHDLESPMLRVLARLDALNDPETSAEERCQIIEAAHSEGSEIADILGSISRMASLERDVDREFAFASLQDVLQSSFDAFEFEATQKQIKLCPDMPPQHVEAYVEKNLLRRAVDNLLSNAIRHTPPDGTIAIVLRTQPEGALISIRDTGSGIPKELISRIFEFGFRGDASSRPAKIGSAGLGLAFVRMVANLHGGDIAVRNLESGGSEFSISLPLAPPRSERADAPMQ